MLVGSRNRGILLLGAALVTALSGHWVANILFDRDQYAGASPSLLGHLNDPVLVQTVLVSVALAALAALAIWGRGRGRRRARPLFAGLGRLQLVGVLVAARSVCSWAWRSGSVSRSRASAVNRCRSARSGRASWRNCLLRSALVLAHRKKGWQLDQWETEPGVR